MLRTQKAKEEKKELPVWRSARRKKKNHFSLRGTTAAPPAARSSIDQRKERKEATLPFAGGKKKVDGITCGGLQGGKKGRILVVMEGRSVDYYLLGGGRLLRKGRTRQKAAFLRTPSMGE